MHIKYLCSKKVNVKVIVHRSAHLFCNLDSARKLRHSPTHSARSARSHPRAPQSPTVSRAPTPADTQAHTHRHTHSLTHSLTAATLSLLEFRSRPGSAQCSAVRACMSSFVSERAHEGEGLTREVLLFGVLGARDGWARAGEKQETMSVSVWSGMVSQKPDLQDGQR